MGISVFNGGSSFRHRVPSERVGNQAIEKQRLLTPGEAAGYLGMTEDALKMMTKRGRIPGVMKIGERKIRYDRRKLDAWIDRAIRHDARQNQGRLEVSASSEI